ncbi:hypothetical protein EVG20_g7194 [Dentipellis fragilis]|uniref:Zn(2)-C6 fungal-type domain-containing protein n=1 Tax=Dentipellis fragilis TaxID=205917 RepID=A0A4Y9YHL6_9AGAM|nr:hypothetical protein EVG20_g7194 [Dentipellis fragilis]
MSSADDEPNNSGNLAGQNTKKRRVQRACDACRRKKSEGNQTPGSKCSTCIEYDVECTYLGVARKRGPPKGYVESLETRLEKMEALLQRLCPDADFSQELDVQLDREGLARDRLNARGPLHPTMLPGTRAAARTYTPPRLNSPAPAGGSGARSSPTDDTEELDPSDDEYAQDLLLQERIHSMQIDPMHKRFVGKSSGVRLVRTAMDMKSQYSGVNKKVDVHNMARRPQFWRLNPWERNVVHDEKKHFAFPEPDLLESLVNLYFKHINVLFPLLHRPTFNAAIAEDLHHRDENFAGVLLLLCACASRYSDDERVLLDGTDSWRSAGWAWFSQVQTVRKALLSAPCLYDLQMYSLSVLYLQGCSGQNACWAMAGIGIRVAQDVGAHRRKVYNPTRTVEDELWKRAFWVLVVLDRMMSAGLGRPCAIQEEDFDIDLPAECDDEYWTHPDPEQAFKQPAGKETYMSYFICFLKLNQILAFALRTIYCINKSKILLGFVGQKWEQHIVAELDSALNKWIDSVPDHLRWDPTREDDTFFLQSASLYSLYYHLQILIHRPFIPSPRKPSPLSFPSLAICTNAARSCSHVVDVQRRRSSAVPLALFQNNPPLVQLPVFTSAIVLLLSVWGVKRSGISINSAREMEDVHKCMRVLKDAESKYESSTFFISLFLSLISYRDVLYEIASVGDLPLPQPSPASSSKREREHDTDDTNEPSTSTRAASAPGPGPRSIAGSQRASCANSLFRGAEPPAAAAGSEYPYAHLPMHTEELGRMPVYQDAVPAYASSLSSADVNAHSHAAASVTSTSTAGNNNSNNNNNNNNDWYMPAASDAPGPECGRGRADEHEHEHDHGYGRLRGLVSRRPARERDDLPAGL